MIEFEPFDLDGIGLTAIDLDLSTVPMPPVPPAWAKPRWWHPCETLEDHAIAVIERYARPTLDRLNAGEDDQVLEQRGERVSLNDLTASFRSVALTI